MSNLALSPLAASSNATVMETIMKPLSYARRPARWLMAAGLALAAMHASAGRGPDDRAFRQASTIDRGRSPASRARRCADPSSRRPASSATATMSSTSCASARRATRRSSSIPAFDGRPENSSAWISATRFRPAWRSSTSRCRATAPTPSADRFLRPSISTIGQPQRHGDDRRLPPDHRRSRRVGRNRPPLCRLRHHRQDRSRGVSGADDCRQPGLRHARPGRRPADARFPRTIRPCRTTATFMTGEPTSILIDVTGCEPPPPPPPPGDDEACFSVETGDVDCVPGGGAFIYHMPVGARAWRQVGAGCDHHARHHRCSRRLAAGPARRRRAQLDDHRRPAGRCRASRRHRHRDLCRTGGGRRPLLHADRRHRHSGGPRMSAGGQGARHPGREARRRGTLHARRRLRLHHPGHQCRRRATTTARSCSTR